MPQSIVRVTIKVNNNNNNNNIVSKLVYRSCGSAVAALRWGLDDNHQTIAKRLKRALSLGLLTPIPLYAARDPCPVTFYGP